MQERTNTVHACLWWRKINITNRFISLSGFSSGEDGKGGGAVQIGKAVGNSDVWFRFNEGVSNAVRRNVYIRELL